MGSSLFGRLNGGASVTGALDPIETNSAVLPQLIGWRQAEVDPRLHFHDLRHCANEIASDAVRNVRELMTHMGHASERAALIYLHAANEGHQAIAAGTDRKLSVTGTDGDNDETSEEEE